MKKATDYHSALASGTQHAAAPVQRFERHGSVFLTHDMALGLPPEMATCDVLYAEPPWKHGYDIFNKRAGVEAKVPWSAFMQRIGEAIEASKLPVALIAGPEGTKHLPPPRSRQNITLNGSYAVLLAYRLDVPGYAKTVPTTQVIGELAARFGRVGDFCCGYGVTGHIFLARGRTCVLSDHNATCIGYIATQVDRWVAEAR